MLALFEGKTPLVVELKPERGNHAELAAATCALLDRYRVDYCIESFDPRCLIWLRKNRPEIIRGQLSSQFLRHGETAGHGKLTMWLLGNLMTNIAVQPDFIAYRFQDRKTPRWHGAANSIRCRRSTGPSERKRGDAGGGAEGKSCDFRVLRPPRVKL